MFIHLLYFIFMLCMKAVHPFILNNYFVYNSQRTHSCFINSLSEWSVIHSCLPFAFGTDAALIVTPVAVYDAITLPVKCCYVHVWNFIVSPELSSGRDLVIQMSVRRVPSAVHVFLSGAYLGNRMTYLDDIWYVSGARSEVVHAEFYGVWQMHIKCLLCIIYV